MGAFAEWQPQYAAHGIATFPVVIDGKDKRPAVKGYLKIGTKVSDQLAMKFPANDAFGLACRRNRITVLDVDTSDERVLADALIRHGPTPFIVRSGSGNWQAWYRHNGETRRVRPNPSLPIDILGDGYVVAPPSLGTKGRYEIVQGTLDDLERLQPMTKPVLEEVVEAFVSHEAPPRKSYNEMREGDGRNPSLLRRALRSAHHANTEEELIQMVAHANQQFAEPLPREEVLSVSHSAWKYKSQGRLMVSGGEATAVVFRSDADHLWDEPLALSLLIRLRMEHSWRNGAPFKLAKGTASALRVSVPTYRAARDTLVDRYFLEIVHPGGKGKNDPPIVRLL
ncbi:conserved hyphotetical protein [Sinorhizobium fredii HH103]|uniref:Conserved hyphotetical protein n=1 Tax=Sinorhizobium fredii (strain HH103) TaxID=1117943 RepID=G9ABB9_SINF1|nr:bifunctional DNA primase/polymerase [Sinorhizobium fredii]CCE97210.1 conserved hyphotetical protein [Sinorhizobium fredii HH103]